MQGPTEALETESVDGPSSPAGASEPATEALPSPAVHAGGHAQYNDPSSAEPDEAIRVLVRVRPAGTKEASNGLVVAEPNDTLRISRAKQGDVRARFDSVLGGKASQEDVFRQVGSAVDSALGGVNATVFAYGQTGSGKTFTLFGGLLQGDTPPRTDVADAESTEGMASRALRMIFARAEGAAAAGMRISVSCSFLEVYNEHITDLLLPASGRAAWGGGGGGLGADGSPALTLCQDDSGEVHVRGLSEVPVHQIGQAMTLVRRALRGRAVRQTDMNSRSSRSHAVLQLVVEQAPAATAGAAYTRPAMRARLNLVDLAGSERAPPGHSEGPGLAEAHKREMGHINKSLSALANCISALAKPTRSHVPYRDSVLTRLLQASLGGNSRTLLIATVSPADKCVDESLSTLRFADRAKHVMLKATPNPTDIGDTLVQQRRRFEARIDRLQQEVMRLKQMLESRETQRQGGGLSALPNGATDAMREERERLQAMLMMERDGAAGGGRSASSESAAMQKTLNNLVQENEKLRGLLETRDEELLAERAEVQRLRALLEAGGGAEQQQQQQQQATSPRHKAPAKSTRAPPPQQQQRPADAESAAQDAEADGMLKEVMEELRMQEKELARIREEEAEIEALLARAGGGRSGGRSGGRTYGGGGLPGGSAYGGSKQASPRNQQQQQQHPYSSPRDTYQEATRSSWQPPPPPPTFGSSGGGGSYGVGLRGRRAEAGVRADPSSMHYDPRADPNSRYYDPELDPNSKWFSGGNTGGFGGGASGGGGFGGTGGSQSARASQPAYGSAWQGTAYGVPPRSGGAPPRSAPAPAASEPQAPHGSPPARRGANGGRSSRRGNKSGGVVAGAAHTSAAMTAVSALATTSGPTDIGSLYYVLGSQASSSRVKQLQKMLELRKSAELQKQQRDDESDRLVVGE